MLYRKNPEINQWWKSKQMMKTMTIPGCHKNIILYRKSEKIPFVRNISTIPGCHRNIMLYRKNPEINQWWKSKQMMKTMNNQGVTGILFYTEKLIKFLLTETALPQHALWSLLHFARPEWRFKSSSFLKSTTFFVCRNNKSHNRYKTNK